MINNQVELDKLAAKIRNCTACPLHQGTTQAVPGEGDPNSKIFLIGEGSGYYEDQSGRPYLR